MKTNGFVAKADEALKGVKTVVCDLDNTLLDSLSMLRGSFPEYNPASQVTYTFEKPEYLEEFAKPSFYEESNVLINGSVVNVLRRAFLFGIDIVFISASPNDEVSARKASLLNEIGWGDYTFKAVSFDVAKELSQFDKDTTLFIDDAPDRLNFLSNGGYRFIKVDHLFNRDVQGHVMSVQPSFTVYDD